MNILTALPLAFVMIAGPQIITAIMLATSTRPKPDSLAFLGGVATATTIGLTIFYVITGSIHGPTTSNGDGSSDALNVAALMLLVVLAGFVFSKRKNTDPPGWMSKLQGASPAYAFGLGFLLFAVMPTDLITMMTVSNTLAGHGEPWWHTLLFMALTVAFAGTPLIMLVLLGHRADTLLPAMRDWMSTNSWIVSEVLIGVFLVVSLRDLLSG